MSFGNGRTDHRRSAVLVVVGQITARTTRHWLSATGCAMHTRLTNHSPPASIAHQTPTQSHDPTIGFRAGRPHRVGSWLCCDPRHGDRCFQSGSCGRRAGPPRRRGWPIGNTSRRCSITETDFARMPGASDGQTPPVAPPETTLSDLAGRRRGRERNCASSQNPGYRHGMRQDCPEEQIFGSCDVLLRNGTEGRAKRGSSKSPAQLVFHTGIGLFGASK